jgi:hypothetical protein
MIVFNLDIRLNGWDSPQVDPVTGISTGPIDTETYLDNVAFDTIDDMKAYVGKIPAVLVSYTIVSQTLDSGSVTPTANSITYTVSLRDTQGNITSNTVSLPFTTPDGVQINTIEDFANYTALQGYIFLSSALVNGSSSSVTAPPQLVATTVTAANGTSSVQYVPVPSNAMSAVPYVFNILIQMPDGSQNELQNVVFPDIVTMKGYVTQIPALLLGYEIVSGGPAGTTYNVIFDAASDTSNAPSTLTPAVATPVISPSTTNSSAGENGPATNPPAPVSNSAFTDPASAGGGTVYRLILATPDLSSPTGFTYNTGATYPSCSINNPNACIPKSFTSLADALSYAAANNETPLNVQSSSEAWSIVSGTQPISSITSGSGLSPTTLLIAAGVLAFLMMK